MTNYDMLKRWLILSKRVRTRERERERDRERERERRKKEKWLISRCIIPYLMRDFKYRDSAQNVKSFKLKSVFIEPYTYTT